MHDRIRTQGCPQQQTNRALGSTYFFCLPGDKWQQRAGETVGNSSGGMRDEREFGGRMGKVMHKKLKQTNKQAKETKTQPKKRKHPHPHPQLFVNPISWEYKGSYINIKVKSYSYSNFSLLT